MAPGSSTTRVPDAAKKILHVENDRGIATLIAEELSDRGYDMRIARNGEEGLSVILKDRPDLVLSEIRIPSMNGFDLLKRLTAMRPRLGTIPFVFLTAAADVECRLEAYRLGADDYLVKPVDFDCLAGALNTRLAARGCVALGICTVGGLPIGAVTRRARET